MFRLCIVMACGPLAAGWATSVANDSSESVVLVRDGVPAATILTVAQPTPAARLAAKELQYCIREITGANLPVATDDGQVDGAKILVGPFRDFTPDALKLNRYEYVIRFQPDAIVLLGRDSKESTGKDIDYTAATCCQGEPDKLRIPGMFDDQGTLRATYDFLERFCGVRFYGPKDDSVVFPKRKTLAVKAADVRREPAIQHASGSLTWDWPIMREQYGNPGKDALELFGRRVRLGGIPWYTNHTLHHYGRRFPRNKHPEFYAPEGGDRLCYSSEELAKQVAQDARDYFDGKRLPDIPGAAGYPKTSIYYPVVPEDAARFCQCAKCRTSLDSHRGDLARSADGTALFNDGRASHLWFRFVNAIATELRTTHPDKFISTLAYENYYWYPTEFKLEPNVAIAPCMAVRNHWHLGYRANELLHYGKWVEGDRPIFLWNYYCFPEEPSLIHKWHCFPGFMAHYLAGMVKQYAKDGIQGVFLCGIGEQVDFYITMKLYDDPTADIDALLTEFFTLYFGEAAEPMQAFYTLIEQTYSNPENWDQTSGFHQTETISWEVLGTKQRMTKLDTLMTEAEELADAPLEKARVAQWKKGVWLYMKNGREGHLRKTD